MPRCVSRRTWIATATTAMIAVGTAEVLLAQTPTIANALGHPSFPSRVIRLQPIGDRTTSPVVTAVAADPRGELLAAAGDDFGIRIIDVATLQVQHTLEGHRDLIRSLSFDNVGDSLVSAGNDGQLIIWDRKRSFEIGQRMQGTPALACVCFAPDGTKIAAVGFDPKVFIIGAIGNETPKFSCDCNDLRSIAYRDDMRVLAVGGRSGDLHLFDPQTGNLIAEPHLHSARIRDIAFHPHSNNVITVAEDGVVTVYDTLNQKKIHSVTVTSGRLFAIATIDSQHIAVAGSDNVIHIVNTDTGVIRHRLEGHVGTVSTLTATGGHLFSGGFDATLRRWSLDELHRSGSRIAEGTTPIER